MSARIFFVAAATFFCVTSATVKAQSFDVGDNVAAFSLGLGGSFGASSAYSSQSPGLGLIYDRGVTELGPGVLGIGGYVGFKSLAYRYNGPGFEYDWKWRYTIVGVRGTWHYNEWHGMDELDVYGGLMLSYNSVKWTDDTRYPAGVVSVSSSASSGVSLSALVGARYYFTENFGAQLELGYGIAYASVGLAYKF